MVSTGNSIYRLHSLVIINNETKNQSVVRTDTPAILSTRNVALNRLIIQKALMKLAFRGSVQFIVYIL